jgi:hypothetical protein
MKQAEDNITIDMWGTPQVATSYMFYVETDTGERIEWDALTITRAKRMHAATQTNTPVNVKTFGWEQVK